MNTALIGKQGAFAVKARVALLMRERSAGLAARLSSSGHDVVELGGWTALAEAGQASPIDLVLYETEFGHDMPRGLSIPAVQVSDGPGAKARTSLGSVPATAVEAASEPLLAMAVELSHLLRRTRDLESLLDGVRSGAAFAGRSPVMRRLQGVLSRAADTDSTVLVEGPQGSGKSLVARIIHCKSRRSDRSLVVVDCAACDAESLARTIDAARGTTLLLPHIDRLPGPAQSVLVRHLKERTNSQASGQPRLIATTSAHLPELVARGAFREDLYYRLHGFPIVLPALREHTEDIVEIAETILNSGVGSTEKACKGFTPAARSLLETMPWPGNVAQLEATVRRAQVLAAGSAIDREHLLVPAVAVPHHAVGTAAACVDRSDEALGEDSIRPFDEEEQMVLSRALRATKGNVRRAAQLLGIGRATLYRKIQQYRLRLQ
ncbi:MAG TPA: sigma 54-interacting transcriptional regulator [Planctomycetota bacterium]|nr:sigma 54-interacting transcriptional regulator [Planctomycetota bacterium]